MVRRVYSKEHWLMPFAVEYGMGIETLDYESFVAQLEDAILHDLSHGDPVGYGPHRIADVAREFTRKFVTTQCGPPV
jgi:hypothetical protein